MDFTANGSTHKRLEYVEHVLQQKLCTVLSFGEEEN